MAKRAQQPPKDAADQLARLREALPAVISHLGPSAAMTRVRYLTYVRGIVPYGERPRLSPNLCRQALRRQLVYDFDRVLRWARTISGDDINPRITEESWASFRNYGIPTLMEELETSGEIEYRPISYGPGINVLT